MSYIGSLFQLGFRRHPASIMGLARSLSSLPVVAAVAWLCSALPISSAEVSREYQLKAAFLYNMIKFVDWPADAFPGPDSPLVIGVFGPNPFEGELAGLVEGRQINGRFLQVKETQLIQDLAGAHVVFVTSDEDRRLADLFNAVAGRSVLTVGESTEFARWGGCITMLIESDRLRFDINMDSAEKAGLEVRAQLQKLARSVKRKR